MSESEALLELLGMLVTDPRTGMLLLLLAIAALSDYRTLKIPNWLTGGGIVFALVYSAVVQPAMNTDWTWAPAGMLLGFAALLPMYALRIMGAGDVKLMAMVGAFLGAEAAIPAVLFSVVTAGIAALVFGARRGVMGQMLGNVNGILRGMLWSAVASGAPRLEAGSSVGKLPYGVSIAAGTTLYLVAQQLTFV